METKTDNELIANQDLIDDFMGRPHWRMHHNHEWVSYHNDWNKLKPVVDKIAEFRLAYPEQANKVCDCKIVIGIEYLYPKVVEFIHWYNSQPK